MPLDRPAGARGAGLRGLAVGCALAWATLHVWFASPLGLLFVELSLNEAEARSVHLAFALLLAGLLGRGSRPVRLALAAAGALTAGYIVARYDELAARPGQIADLEIALGASGLGLLLVAAWQVVGRALAVLCAVALVAMVVGVGSGVDVVLTQWFSTRGVFGAPLGLSSQFLLLAGVFALLLAGSGVAGDWAALIDRLWPGAPPGAGGFAARLLAGLAAPGSAAAARAGAVAVGPARDVAALAVVAALMSQAVPPLLGYVIALVPGTLRIAPASVLGGTAVVGALAIAGIVMVWRGPTAPPPRRIALWLVATGALGAAGFGVVSGFAHAKASYGGAVSWIAAATTLAVGLALQWRELRLAPATTARLAVAALRGALPLLMLVWGIVVEGLDPALVVFWAIGFMIFALLTRALLEPARHRHGSLLSLAQALRAVARGVVRGVESAVPVAIAAAAAGLLIAAAAALDLPHVLTTALDWTTTGGALTAVVALGVIATGCGALLPTVPAYLLIAVALVPVLLDLAARAGSAMPLLAAHLCLFYCAVIGSAFAGGGVHRAPGAPVPDHAARRQAWRLLVPLLALAVALPFNGDLLAFRQPGWIESTWALAGAISGIGVLAGLLRDDWRRARPRWAVVALAIAAASLLAPRLWLETWFPGTAPIDARRLIVVAGSLTSEAGLTVIVDRPRPRAVTMPLGPPGGGAERLASAGLELRQEGERVTVARVSPASWADRTGLRPGTTILTVRAPIAQPSLGFVVLPLGALAYWLVRRRSRPGLRTPASPA